MIFCGLVRLGKFRSRLSKTSQCSRLPRKEFFCKKSMVTADNGTRDSNVNTVIPVVDMSSVEKNKTEIASKLRHACIDVGFFYLVGHGLEPSFLRRVMLASKELFDLDETTKQNLKDSVMQRGYTPFEEETLDPAVQKTRGDTKEGYYICTDIAVDDPRYNPAKLAGPNVWPTPETVHKNAQKEFDCDKWKEIMTEYFHMASRVAMDLIRLLALALDLEEHYFDEFFADPLAALRLLHYSNEASIPEDGLFACGAHSDYGMVFLLLTDDQPGLEILVPSKNGEGTKDQWISVPPRGVSFTSHKTTHGMNHKGEEGGEEVAFIVNLGDMLERWTNGLFRSTVHRVVVPNHAAERYSIPFFYEPNFDCLVTCLESCRGEDGAKYPPVTSGEHLLAKYRETHAEFDPASP